MITTRFAGPSLSASRLHAQFWRSLFLDVAPAITARIALDYELVAEQFRDFLHDGSTVLDFGDKDEKPEAAAA